MVMVIMVMVMDHTIASGRDVQEAFSAKTTNAYLFPTHNLVEDLVLMALNV